MKPPITTTFLLAVSTGTGFWFYIFHGVTLYIDLTLLFILELIWTIRYLWLDLLLLSLSEFFSVIDSFGWSSCFMNWFFCCKTEFCIFRFFYHYHHNYYLHSYFVFSNFLLKFLNFVLEMSFPSHSMYLQILSLIAHRLTAFCFGGFHRCFDNINIIRGVLFYLCLWIKLCLVNPNLVSFDVFGIFYQITTRSTALTRFF